MQRALPGDFVIVTGLDKVGVIIGAEHANNSACGISAHASYTSSLRELLYYVFVNESIRHTLPWEIMSVQA